MIRTDGRPTIANAPVRQPSVEENADAFLRTLAEIRELDEAQERRERSE